MVTEYTNKSNSSDSSTFRTFKAKTMLDNKENIFVAVGRTTPWDDTQNPEPIPYTNRDTKIEEIVALKRADQVLLVYPDNINGTIEQYNQKWRILTEEEARTLESRWVYVSAWLNFDSFPVVTYRQTAVFIQTKVKPEIPSNQQVIMPSNVLDYGYQAIINNRPAVPRDETQKELIEFIIEM